MLLLDTDACRRQRVLTKSVQVNNDCFTLQGNEDKGKLTSSAAMKLSSLKIHGWKTQHWRKLSEKFFLYFIDGPRKAKIMKKNISPFSVVPHTFRRQESAHFPQKIFGRP